MYYSLAVLTALLVVVSTTHAHSVFTDFTHVDPSSSGRSVHRGVTPWEGLSPDHPHNSTFYVMPQIVDRSDTLQVIELMKTAALQFDLDSVDNAATFQFWLYSHERQYDETEHPRLAVRSILHDYIEKAISPLIRRLYPDVAAAGEEIVPCFSFVRRYDLNERSTHQTHFDISSYLTFVVSLNSAGDDFEGGIYVATDDRNRMHLDLKGGDAVMHQSDLLHGVQISSGLRWSWVLWFKPGSCNSAPVDWHTQHAEEGDPIHQFLLAHRTHAGLAGNGKAQEGLQQKRHWLERSARSGFARAQNDLGDLLRTNESKTADDVQKAGDLFMASAQTEPQAMYNLGLWFLDQGNEEEATQWFERACDFDSVDGCHNLAIAYHNGVGGKEANTDTALRLLERVRTPDSLWLAYQISGEKLEYLHQASKVGSADAQYTLGLKELASGNRQKGLGLLAISAQNGFEPSQQHLMHLKRSNQLKKDEL